VAQPPNDAISNVVFAPDQANRLLVSSWDKNVYMYEIIDGAEEATLVNKYEHRAPVLDVCFGADFNEAFSASMDWHVNRCDDILSRREAS
jgi:cell cycle arrest protein BUB3